MGRHFAIAAFALIVVPTTSLCQSWNFFWRLQAQEQMREVKARNDSLSKDILQARLALAQQYPDGKNVAAAQAALTKQLGIKDRMYCVAAVVPLAGRGIIGATPIDSGIPANLDRWFNAWVNATRGPSAVDWFDQKAFLGRLTAAESHPSHRDYLVRRDWGEYNRLGKPAPGVPDETWRLFKVAASLGREDPYQDAVNAAALHRGFALRCPEWLSSNARGAPANACRCIDETLGQELKASDYWSIESDFSEENFLVLSVATAGLHDKLRKCLR